MSKRKPLTREQFDEQVTVDIYATMEIAIDEHDFWFDPDDVEAKLDNGHDIQSALAWLQYNDKYDGSMFVNLEYLQDQAYAAYLAHMAYQEYQEQINGTPVLRALYRLRNMAASVLIRAAQRIVA